MGMKILTKEDIVNQLVNDPYQYAAIYARESNPNAPNAIDTQIYTCEKYAHKKNILIYKTYKEFVSATQISYKQRKEFARLIEDAKKGYFKKIILTRRDRLTRSFEDFIDIKNLFKKLDIEIIYSNDIQIDEKRDYACNFVENILMGLAEMEPRRIADRTREGKIEKIKKKEYDKRAPYGLKYKKIKKTYYHDGLKAKVVREIFDIYLGYETVKNENDVIEKLKKRNKEKDNKEYSELIKQLNRQKIKAILSRSIYATLHINDIKFNYKEFHIKYNGEIHKVDEKYLQEYKNVKGIITPEQWYRVVEKWYKHNSSKKKIVKKKIREKIIFKDLFVCTKCEKILKYKDGKFSCESEGCRGISRDILIRDIIKSLVKWMVYKNKEDEIVYSVVRKLNIEINKLKKKLIKSINKQDKLVGKYLENSIDENIREKIIEEVDNQKDIKQQIDKLNEKVNFLNKKFKEIIIPLVKSDYIHLIEDELVKNQSELIEIFIYENIKEMKISGHQIRINDEPER